MNTTFHAFCLAAPRSGEGKTTTGIALMRALARRGLKVQSFKCGPDYIDPTFHAQATGRPACNLDTWMMGREGVRALWDNRAHDADACVCEGVMGLFDSRDPGDPAGGTADCARALGIPVVLVFNARGMACSAAALVAGFRLHASRMGVQLAGVIANNVGSPRHADILRRALESEQKGLHPFPPFPCFGPFSVIGSAFVNTLPQYVIMHSRLVSVFAAFLKPKSPAVFGGRNAQEGNGFPSESASPFLRFPSPYSIYFST